MRRLDDEILMAYVDGALSGADCRHVEAEIVSDTEARRLLTLYRSTAALARHAFDEPMWSEPPRRLLAVLEARAKRARFMHAVPTWFTGWAGAGGLAAVASLALLVWVGGGEWRLPPKSTERATATADALAARVAVGTVPRPSELARILDDLSGGEATRADPRYSLVATLTDKWGNTCKEVDRLASTPEAPPAFVFVACRTSGGEWTVVGAVAPVVSTDASRRLYYVRSETAAHEALSSVLSMMGAQQRASALKPKTTQQ